MVKKLLRYEMKTMKKWLIPVSIALIAFAIVGRIFWLFEVSQTQNPIAYSILHSLQYTGVGIFTVTLIALVTIAVIMYVVRFYRHMMSQEGYLTFCLPVTVSEHLMAKWIAAFICEVCVGVVALMSVLIYNAGTETMRDYFGMFGQLIMGVYSGLGIVHLVLFIVEGLLALITMLAFYPMLFYTCISIGQLMVKHRILGAILCYGGWQIISQFLSSFVMFIGMFTFIPLLDKILVDSHAMALFMHIIMWLSIIVSCALAVVFFRISRKVLTEKLNLE